MCYLVEYPRYALCISIAADTRASSDSGFSLINVCKSWNFCQSCWFFIFHLLHWILDNRIFILYNHNGYMVSFHADLNKLMQIGTSLAMNNKIIVKVRIISLKPFIFFHNKKNLTLLRLLLAFANFLSFRSEAKNNQWIFQNYTSRIFLYIHHLIYSEEIRTEQIFWNSSI